MCYTAIDNLTALPYWDRLTEAEKELLQKEVIVRSFSKNELISSYDTSCLGMVMVLQGQVRVYIVSEDGREITLFRLNKGDYCVTTAACVIKQLTFDTVISAETDTEMLVVPTSLFNKLAEENIYVKASMYELLAERFSAVMWIMQQILFKRFDQRLAEFFVSCFEANGSKEILMTQEEIAVSVNSAREVVARMLRQFASDGLITVQRGRIIIMDIDALYKLR